MVGPKTVVFIKVVLMLAIGTVLVGLPGTAEAQSLHADDGRRDVAAMRRDGTFVAVRRATYPDVVSIGTAHRPRSITLVARYRDLRPQGVSSAFNLTIGTPDNSKVSYDVITEPGIREGYIEPFEGVGEGDFFCTGDLEPALRYPRWRIDYVRDIYRIRVPRTCLNRPEWVRIGFVSSVDEGRRVLYDVPGPRVRPPFDGSPLSLAEPLYRD